VTLDDDDKVQLVVVFEPEQYKHSQLANIRNRHVKEAVESEKLWSSFSDARKQILIEIVQFTIENAHYYVKDWLPFCLLESSEEGGQFIHFRGAISLTDVDSAVDNTTKATELKLEQMRRSMEANIRGEDVDSSEPEKFINHCKKILRNGIPLTLEESMRLIDLAS